MKNTSGYWRKVGLNFCSCTALFTWLNECIMTDVDYLNIDNATAMRRRRWKLGFV